jgi:predicted permease
VTVTVVFGRVAGVFVMSNNGFMGFPVVLAVFGATGLFYIIVANICVIILSSALPCAALPAVFAQEYGANAKLAAEGAFLSTMFSMASLPVVTTQPPRHFCPARNLRSAIGLLT